MGGAFLLYDLVARKGPDHAPVFTIGVTIEGFDPETAQGRSRQDAEKAAASAMLANPEPQENSA